ncbi:MAG: SDR family oxidoreductase [Burkholderiales bacterium]|nr:SDR family oxidoreductase [Opitutaceae bacterium]
MKTALITGALGGIGQALCSEFQKAGYFVIGTDKREGKCACDAFLNVDIRDLYAKTEVREHLLADIRAILGEHGLTVLINNAASQVLNRTDDVKIADWDDTLETNLIAPFLLIQSLLPDLEKARGSVVNIASIHAVATKPGFVCYATSKAALVGMTRALAVDLGPRVRVNAINPAATATPMLLAGFEGRSAEFDELAKKHPLERIAQPWEVAKTALFLASPDAAFITGASLHIDGGIGGRLHDPV